MESLVSRLQGCSRIAVDTEFFRETTYYPQLALVQIATDDIVACVDPLAFDARQSLSELFLDPGLVKIFHACSQDMEVLYYYLGEVPVSIYDTQLANALLSDQHQIGYASLVERELGIVLDKSQTRTNWLQRPLTDKQLAYAGDDVLYLYQLHDTLDARLVDMGRKGWLLEDTARLTAQLDHFAVDTDNLWKRVKGSNKISRDKLAITQAVAEWRERLAQQKDKTRRRLLADDVVLRLADQPADDLDALESILGPRYKFSTDSMQSLLKAIDSAVRASPESWPDNSYTVLNKQQKTLLKELQCSINEKAEALGLSSAVLSSRKELERLILAETDKQNNDRPRHSELTDENGWRYQQFGQQLLEIIRPAAENTK